MICQSWKVMFQAEYSSGQPLRMLVDLRASVDGALGRGSARRGAKAADNGQAAGSRGGEAARRRSAAQRASCAKAAAAAARSRRLRRRLHRAAVRERRKAKPLPRPMRMLQNSKFPPRRRSGIRMRTRNRARRNKRSEQGRRRKRDVQDESLDSRESSGFPKRKLASGSSDRTGYLRRRGIFPEHHRALANGAPRTHVHHAQRRSLATFRR